MARPAHSESSGPVPPAPPLDQEAVLSWAEQLTTFLGEAFKVSGFSMQSGTLTLTGSSPLTVSNANVTANSRIILSPTSSVPVGTNSVVQKINTWISTSKADPVGDSVQITADMFLPVDGDATTATFTPTTDGNPVVVMLFGGHWDCVADATFGLKLHYDGTSSPEIAFWVQTIHEFGVAVAAPFTTGTGTDAIRLQASSVAPGPAQLPHLNAIRQRTLIAVEYNNAGGGSAGVTNVFVDTKTVANGSFNINWTGTAASETFDYVIMHKDISA